MELVPLSTNNRTATLETLKLMWKLAKDGKTSALVFQSARQIINNVPNKAFAQEVEAIYWWVAENIRYTLDVHEVETLQLPEWTIKIGHGDCDDHAILLAALLQTVGHPVRFKAVKAQGNGPNYCHVFTETKIGNRWIALDTTLPEKGIGYIDSSAHTPLIFAR